jgi:hypothetical protein
VIERALVFSETRRASQSIKTRAGAGVLAPALVRCFVCYVVLSRDLPVVAEAPVIIVVEAPVIVAEVVIVVIVAVAYDFQDTQLTGRGVQCFAKL